jgi:cystinosin
MSSSWNSVGLEVLYQVIGWIAFAAWSFSFYPQVVLNYRRKSVVGLNFDFLVLNLTKHSSYLIYNAALFFSPIIQKQYHEKFGDKEVRPHFLNLYIIHVGIILGGWKQKMFFWYPNIFSV